MEKALEAIAARLSPDLPTRPGPERVGRLADIWGLLYTAPLALAGLAWLVAATDWALLGARWPTLLLLLALVLVFRRLSYFLMIEVRRGSGQYADFAGSLDAIVLWSAAWLLGPGALWLGVIAAAASAADARRLWASPNLRWNILRIATTMFASSTLVPLVALALYAWAGGTFPLAELTLAGILPALYATLANLVLSLALFAPLFAFYGRHWTVIGGGKAYRQVLLPTVAMMAAEGLMVVFSILAAGLYVQVGTGAYLFFLAGAFLAALLAHRLSLAAERNRRWSSQMEMLERLGRAILAGPPDASTLGELLAQHVPGMFPRASVAIRLFPDTDLLQWPPGFPAVPAPVWAWLAKAAEPQAIAAGEPLPWGGQASGALAVAPIVDSESGRSLGGIYATGSGGLPFQSGEVVPIHDALPVMHSLAAQIAAALRSADEYARTLAHQRVQQELALAHRIQLSFLPAELPQPAGWQVAAHLEPAHETSGDYYDLIPLEGGRLGIVVADVADKGMGAALFMALSRTLLRTCAAAHPTRPDLALAAANRRILSDTQSDMFVTVFYGVLDPASATLAYANAGHNPPYWLSPQNGGPEALEGTGMPLGLFEEAAWAARTLELAAGDRLLLYTDGITEAQDGEGAFYGDERLLAVARANARCPAQALQEAVLADLSAFVGDAPAADDVTLVVVGREG